MDIKLTKTGDLDLSTGDIQLTDSLAQAVAIRLRWILGEWKLGPTLGMPYFQSILVKNPDTAEITRRIRSEILSVEGINDITAFTLNIDSQKRTMKCTFTAVTATTTERMEVEVNV